MEILEHGWIDAKKYQPEVSEENYSDRVLAICDGELMVMCYCYNPSEDDEERGYFWANCYGDINGECEFDDNYEVQYWQPLPKLI